MAKTNSNKKSASANAHEPERRDFMVVATYAMAGLGAAAVAWPQDRRGPINNSEMARQASFYSSSHNR